MGLSFAAVGIQYHIVTNHSLRLDADLETVKAANMNGSMYITKACRRLPGDDRKNVEIQTVFVLGKNGWQPTMGTPESTKTYTGCKYPYKESWQFIADALGIFSVPALAIGIDMAVLKRRNRWIAGCLILIATGEAIYLLGTARFVSNLFTWSEFTGSNIRPNARLDILYPLVLSGLITVLLSSANYLRERFS